MPPSVCEQCKDLISSIPWDVMVSAFGGGIDEPTDGTDRPQFESTDTLKAARFLKFVTILKLLRNIFEDFQFFFAPK